MLDGQKTSVSLEQEFWNGMKVISSERGKTLSELVSATRPYSITVHRRMAAVPHLDPMLPRAGPVRIADQL